MSIRRPDHSRRTRVLELAVADDPDAWRSAGFDVGPEGTVDLGGPVVRLLGDDGGPRGIRSWMLAAAAPAGRRDLDGLATTFRPPATGDAPIAPAEHPNGIVGLDHIVVATPDLERTITAFSKLGVPCRRIRDVGSADRPMRQGFFKFGPTTIEAVSDDSGVGSPAASRPATWFGLAVDAEDLDVLGKALGPSGTGAIREAVQPNRRIVTIRHRAFDISVRLAALDDHADRPSIPQPLPEPT